MTIYVDYLIIDNVAFDSFLLWLVATTVKRPCKWWRILLASLLGALCAFVSVFFKGVLLTVVKFLFVVPICWIALGKKRLFVVVLLFVAYTFLLGGAIIGLFNVLNVGFVLDGNFGYYLDIPLGVFIFAILLVAICVKALACYVYSKKRVESNVYTVKIEIFGNKYTLQGFWDSGNLLICNGRPVCFGVGSFKSTLSTLVAQGILAGATQTVSFNTVNGVGSCLAIEATVTLNGKSMACYLALPKGNYNQDYQILLNGGLQP